MVRVCLAFLGLGSASPDAASVCDLSAGDDPDDCIALCELHDATGQSMQWCDGSSLCTWDHVTCSGGRVSQLIVNDNRKLSGTIPESLGQLANLERLDLRYNDLSGTIPESLGQLSNLEILGLGYNKLSGTIPESLGQLANLKGFDLSFNELSGTIPESLGQLSNLELLWLGNNKLTEWASESLCSLVYSQDLDRCDLSDNAFVCPLPGCASRCSATCAGMIV